MMVRVMLPQTVTTGGALSLTATSAYDLAGRMIQQVTPGSYSTGSRLQFRWQGDHGYVSKWGNQDYRAPP